MLMPMMRAARRGHAEGRREVAATGLRAAGLGGTEAAPGGSLFLSSTAANALGTEIIPPGDRNHWSGFLEIWRSHGCATLVCLFCRPWLSVATDK